MVTSQNKYPRDMIGYGGKLPDIKLPGNARIAVQFVLNYEEGGENSVLHGDGASETFLSEIIGARAYEDRHMSMESLYEYGSRAGFWRVHDFFVEQNIPLTIFGVGMALERNPEAVRAMLNANWEIACHGYRWIDHQFMPREVERNQIAKAMETHLALTGALPVGWYGRDSPNTRTLVLEHENILYDSDSYADDLPYWVKVQKLHILLFHTRWTPMICALLRLRGLIQVNNSFNISKTLLIFFMRRAKKHLSF